jgi:hypothetical protein
MDPGKRKLERSVFCFLPADFLVSRVGGKRFQSGAPIFFIYERDFSRLEMENIILLLR